MRNALLLLALVASLAACGSKKKAVANPSNSGQTEAAPGSGSNDEQNMNTPADPNDPAAKSSDPCEGGE